jgi:hypothetical protein
MTRIWRGLAVMVFSLLAICSTVAAAPVTGAVSLISSNNATIAVAGITGDVVWVMWGQGPGGGEVWATPNQTATGGVASVTIQGAPILGDTVYYASACDVTGCDTGYATFTTLPVTPPPVPGFGAAFSSIVASHFNLVLIGGYLFSAYTNLMPTSVMFGLLFGIITLGIWDRTKSVRTIAITMCIISPFIVTSGAGLYLGLPLVEQAIGQALLAAGLAGILLSFIKK